LSVAQEDRPTVIDEEVNHRVDVPAVETQAVSGSELANLLDRLEPSDPSFNVIGHDHSPFSVHRHNQCRPVQAELNGTCPCLWEKYPRALLREGGSRVLSLLPAVEGGVE